jgi:hypothetical protein
VASEWRGSARGVRGYDPAASPPEIFPEGVLSVANRTVRLVEAIERRVAWVAISLAITVAFNTTGTLAFGGIGTVGKWELTFYVGSLVSMAAAGVLLVGALAPDFVRPLSLAHRNRFVFFAFALLVLALIVIVGLSAHAAIEVHRHAPGEPPF